MVMLFRLIFFIIPKVLPLHSQVGYDGIILEFKDEVLAVAVDIFEGLTDQMINKDGGLRIFDNARIKRFD